MNGNPMMDIHNDSTLAGEIQSALEEEAASGVRVELHGIELDQNEWTVFFLNVARRILRLPSVTPTEQADG